MDAETRLKYQFQAWQNKVTRAVIEGTPLPPPPPYLAPHVARFMAAAAAKAEQAAARARDLAPVVAQMQDAGCRTLVSYAAALTARGLPSPSGRGPWHRSAVARLLNRLEMVTA